jgi:3-oxoacyl-[acyl-carrier protein] reductase
MDLHLDNRVVMVAGSSRGIGKATARAFLKEGCRTIITGRDETSLNQTQTEFEAEFGSQKLMVFQGDLREIETEKELIKKTLERWKAIDCLIANIGTGRGKTGWDLKESDWVNSFEANFSSSVRLVTQALPGMIEAGKGSIVFVASIVGVESTNAPLPYSAAKSALINFSKNLSRQTGPFNIRVNCVAPGNILFPGGSWEMHLSKRKDEIMQMINSEVPLQRFGKPEEIADLIVYLSSDRASFITGACIVADGGQTRAI